MHTILSSSRRISGHWIAAAFTLLVPLSIVLFQQPRVTRAQSEDSTATETATYYETPTGSPTETEILAPTDTLTSTETVTRTPEETGTPTATTTETPTQISTITPTSTGAHALLSDIDAVSAGFAHTCALTTSGGVKCWGYNPYGQLGDGTNISRSEPGFVTGLVGGVTAVASGYNHTCALTIGGGVKCWGFNYFGQLGNGTTTNSKIPVDVTGLSSGVVAITAGNNFSCAVTSDGGVQCWGYNSYGQLGDGTTTNRSTPVAVNGLANIINVISASTGFHVCALTSSGGVKCWGYNFVGQLGNGTTNDSSVPVDVSGLTTGVIALSAGSSHTCAVTSEGGAKCWGDNYFGELGDGTRIGHTTPVNVGGLTSGVSGIAAGFANTCVLTSGGGVKCWGSGAFGALGNGTNIDSTLPVDVNGMAGGTSAIDLGDYFACGVTDGGGVKCWGKNDSGQLGNGTLNNSNVPVDAVEPAPGVTPTGMAAQTSTQTLTPTATIPQTPTSTETASETSTGTPTDTPTPSDTNTPTETPTVTETPHPSDTPTSTQTITNSPTITRTPSRTKTSTRTSTNTSTITFTPSITNTPTMTITPTITPTASGTYTPTITKTSTITPTRTITKTSTKTPTATSTPSITSTPTITLTRTNTSTKTPSITKTPSVTPTVTPTQSATPTPVPTWTSTLPPTDTPTETRTETPTESATPTPIPTWTSTPSPTETPTETRTETPTETLTETPTDIPSSTPTATATESATPTPVPNYPVVVTVRNNGGFTEAGLTVYVDRAADLSYAGYSAVSDAQGQVNFLLPQGTYRFRVEKNGQKYWSGISKYWQTDVPPCAVPGCSSDWVQVGMTFKAIAAGGDFTCGLISSDGIKCWGDNSDGQLGDGTTTHRVTPVDVAGLTNNVLAISTSYGHMCALLGNEGVKCWGYNGFGQLGDGSTTNRLAPVDVVGLDGGVVAVSTGQYHTCAVLAGGGVKCWGDNFYGELGNGTTTDSDTPVDVTGLTDPVVSVSVGTHYSCALTDQGGVKCWGDNSFGQLGDGTNTERHSPVDVVGLSMGTASLSAFANHTCALSVWGNIECWGANAAGELGDGTFIGRNTPVIVVGISTDIQAIATGYGHTCALTDEGGVKCWGWNPFGQLGNGTFASSNLPVDVVGLTSGVTSISTGHGHTCAVLMTGMAKCWGEDDSYELGDYGLTNRNTPVNVYWFIY